MFYGFFFYQNLLFFFRNILFHQKMIVRMKTINATIWFVAALELKKKIACSSLLFAFFSLKITLYNVGLYFTSPTLTLKEKGEGAESAPSLDIFCYISAGCYFFALKLHDFFSSSLALNLRSFFFKIGPRVMTRRCVIERWVQQKTDKKLIFNGNYSQIVFFVFRIHFHYVLSSLFGLFGVRTCVSILWHTSLPKKVQLCLKK